MITFETALEVIAMIVALVFVRFSSNIGFKFIAFILTLTAINESLIIPFVISHNLFERNIDYNLFSLIDMTVWFVFLYNIFQSAGTKKWIVLVYVLNMGYSLAELTVIHGWNDFHSNSLRAYDISIICISIYYLFLLLKKEYHELWKDSLFWVCIACILYHSTVFISFTSIAESESYWKDKDAFIVYNFLQNIANAFYYILLSAAFFVNYWNYKNDPRP